MSDAIQTAETYLAIWNEPAPDQRRRLIENTFTAEATYVDPMGRGEGFAGIDALVTTVRGSFPGHRFTRYGQVDAHGEHLRFSWELSSGTGAVVARGTDYAQLNGQGRLKSVTGFIDYLAAQN